MWKLLISLLAIFFMSCSNTPGRKYKVETMEVQADEYMSTGNRFRLNRDYKEALSYYNLASNLYFLKWGKRKFVLTELNKILIYIKTGRKKKAEITLENTFIMNKVENLGLDTDIKGIQVRLHLLNKEGAKAKKVLDDIINSLGGNKKRLAYYVALKAEKIGGYQIRDNALTGLISSFNDLYEDYIDGDEVNTEGLVYINHVLANIFLRRREFSTAKAYLEKYETLLNDLELTGQVGKLFESYHKLYSASGDQQMTEYYSGLINQYKRSSRKL